MDIVLDTQTEEAEMHRHPGNRYFCVLGNKKKALKLTLFYTQPILRWEILIYHH